ncbi:SLAM family member 8-like [Tiliqua scincoides]|uniref:SLAM family member 8-like n=1 Tax=Tiliqua scincoides TaxID=71010 RepID=UPI003462181B
MVHLPPGFHVRDAIWRSLTPAEELVATSFKDDLEILYRSRFTNRTRLHHNLTLEIRPVRLGDDGTLSVLLVNTAGEMEQQVFQLEVYDVVSTPVVQIFTQERNANSSVVPCAFFLTCIASQGSNITYRWTRPDGTALARDKHAVLDNSRVLRAELDFVEDTHLSYTCTVSNAVSQRSVTVDVQKICQKEMGTKDSAYDYRNLLLIVVPLASLFLAAGAILIMHTKQKSGKKKSYEVSESELA